MVTRCDTSKVKGLQVGPSAKNAHIAGKGQQQLCLHFSVQKLFSSHNGSSAYNGWMDLLVPGGQGTRTASLFASKALLSPSSILEQRLGNTWDTIRKSGTDVDTPQNVLLLWAVQIIILQKKKHAKCKTVTCQNAYRHTMFAATPSPIHRNGFWWRSQHPNIASSRTPSCVDYLGRSTDLGWGVCLYKEIMGVWSLDPANEDVEHWRKTEVPKLEKEWIGASNLRHKILKYLST